MKQPGAKSTPDALVRAVKRADAILARMMATETYMEGATAYTAPSRPGVAAANAAMDLRLPPGVAAGKVIDAVESHFAAAGVRCHSLDASDTQWPAELAALLAQRGYRPIQRQVHVLSDYAPPAVDAEVQVIPGRAAYAELRAVMKQRAAAQCADEATCGQVADAVMDQLDDPRIDVMLARRNRKPVGAVSLLTLGNLGVLLDLFALPSTSLSDASGDAVIATLAARMLDHCQRAQFEQVMVRLNADDEGAPRFAKLGFKPVTGYVSYGGR